MKIAEENPTYEQLLAEPKKFRNLLYENKVLVLRDLHLTADEFYAVHKIFGRPWAKELYSLSHEIPTQTEAGSVFTTYSNVLMKKSLGNGSIGWHRDIPFHRGIRYPIRSLYPLALPDEPGSTLFADANVLWSLPLERQEQLKRMKLEIQSWYDVVFDHPVVQRIQIPLVEEHPHTRKLSILLNAPGDRGWVQNLWLDGRALGMHQIHEFISIVNRSPIYEHRWKLGDLVLFDNWSGVMHSRKALETGDQERSFWRINVKHGWQR